MTAILETELTLSEPGRLSPEFLAAIARSKGRAPAKDIVEVKASEILSISAQINPPAPVSYVNTQPLAYAIGTSVEGKGIYFGNWEMPDLNKTFNLFAMPLDYGPDLTIDEAVKAVADIRNYLGHDGGYYPDEAIFSALGKGQYKGEWFIPPIDILSKLIPSRNKGDLKGFQKGNYAGSNEKILYLSCEIEAHKPIPFVRCIHIPDDISPPTVFPSSEAGLIRLVRAELVP